MSKHVATRSHEQCRSHHQKMIKNYKSVDAIIQHLSQELEQKNNLDDHSSDQNRLTAPDIKQIHDFENESNIFGVLNWGEMMLEESLPFLEDEHSCDFI
jgi:hypothetical protein